VPKTDILWRKLLTLPLYPDLTDDDMNYIIETIRSFVP
jgi:dTDP-4-amino-4,6-dideoxygalactose transaminase